MIRPLTLARLLSVVLPVVAAACSSEPGPSAPRSPVAKALVVSGLPSSVTAGDPVTGTVTAKDASGNTAFDYTGTVHFNSTDPAAHLPSNHTFVDADRGSYTFTAAFQTAGTQTVTATDVATSSVNGGETVTVTPASRTPSSRTPIPIAFQSSLGIEVIGADGLGRKVLIADPTVFEPAWSPDGTRLAFTRTSDGWNTCEIYTALADGSGAQRITAPLSQPWCANSPAWSPDGTKIAFAAGPAGCSDSPKCFGQNLYVMNADGSNARQLISATTLPPITAFPSMLYEILSAPTWSPDGTKLAFECWPFGFGPGPDYFEWICSGHSDGSAATQLSGVLGGEAPAWSPDGSQIASGGGQISLLNLDGSVARYLTDPLPCSGSCPDSTDSDPAWSPDSTRLVFTRGRLVLGGTSRGDLYVYADLFIVNRDGSGLRRLTTTGDAYHPTWSPAIQAASTHRLLPASR